MLGGSLARADNATPPAPPADGWIGKGEAGLLLSRGNADATSANAKLDIARQSGDCSKNTDQLTTINLVYNIK